MKTAIGKITAGSTTKVTIDGVDFYVLAKSTVTSYNSNGVSQGNKSAALLWAANNVTLPSSVSYSSSVTNKTYFHNRTTSESLWTNSYMRTDVLPELLKTIPTLVGGSIIVRNSTSGYFAGSATATPTTTTTAETTYDQLYILSQPDFLSYLSLGDSRASAEEYYWLRSATNSEYVKLVDPSGTSNMYHNNSGGSWGVRPAVWVAL